MTEPFDVCGPLPTGTTVLEASAGTGKTYAIAALAARYVADGVPLEKLLLVTFTRMATSELSDRVRERLREVETGLARALDGERPDGRDRVLALLAEGPREEVARRRRRLARALADFDAATILTTHGFCHEVLRGLGVAGDVDPGTELVEDVADLRDEVVDDLYVRRFHWDAAGPAVTRAEAGRIAEVAAANPTEPIEPAGAPDGSVAAMRVRLAREVRRELERRKRARGVMTYDDLLTRLAATLDGSEGPAVAARLRERFSVVLVDEFQDTDPVQWEIVRRAFAGDPDTTLVLIGDPKQAIYAFRGADVFAYLEAARTAGAQRTLGVNWRSDEGLVRALDTVFGGARLGHEGIEYRRVEAAEANRAPRLHGAPVAAPLRVRVVHRDEPSIGVTRYGHANTQPAREHIARDVAAEVVRLLASGAEVELRREDGTPTGRTPVRPGDVAVLVRTHKNAALVHAELQAAGVPAVINGAGSVFGTVAATEWLRLLEALERPASVPRAHSAALTPFLGWPVERVATATDADWEDVHRTLHRWSRVLRAHGVAALTETITHAQGLPARVLAERDGERRLTDLRHLAQLLHHAATSEQLGTTALAGWLRRRIAAAAQESGDEERTRRLESDAAAVQVLTIHRSKGLEFPVVMLPFLWEPGWIPRDPQPVFFHDPARGDARTIDVGLDGPDFDRHRALHRSEQRGEDLRLAYVALTRARHQAVVWWAASFDSRESPLGRLLFGRAADGAVVEQLDRSPEDGAAVSRLEELAAASPGCLSVERASLGVPVSWSPPLHEPAPLVAAGFDRDLDARWRRTSFSDLTAGTHEARVASEPEEDEVRDEDPAAAPRPAPAPSDADLVEARLRDRISPLAGMPGGVRVGTLVHEVLELTDFAASDLDAELARQVDRVRARRRVEVGDPAAVVTGLRAAIATPLDPVLPGVRLRDVARADRLDELAFELPLVGGDRPSGEVTLAAIAAVLRDGLPADDPLAGYADRLADPALRSSVRGFLTGSIDLVVRVRGADGAARYAIADHKTNWLAPQDEPLSAWHYRPSALAAEMGRSHYALQALLYAVALHRYLRWRGIDHDPSRDLAGVLYLFVRGMDPDHLEVDGGRPGVFAWRPPGALVVALSDLLDEGTGA